MRYLLLVLLMVAPLAAADLIILQEGQSVKRETVLTWGECTTREDDTDVVSLAGYVVYENGAALPILPPDQTSLTQIHNISESVTFEYEVTCVESYCSDAACASPTLVESARSNKEIKEFVVKAIMPPKAVNLSLGGENKVIIRECRNCKIYSGGQ